VLEGQRQRLGTVDGGQDVVADPLQPEGDEGADVVVVIRDQDDGAGDGSPVTSRRGEAFAWCSYRRRRTRG
jgi:hypothetical protein